MTLTYKHDLDKAKANHPANIEFFRQLSGEHTHKDIYAHGDRLK